MAAHDQGLKVWSANAGRNGQFKYTGTYDVAWGPAGAATPSLLMMVKTGGCHQEDQELLEFLNDVVVSAYDSTLLPPNTKLICACVIHPGPGNKNYWPLMTQMNGAVTLCLHPMGAASARAPSAGAWINHQQRALVPTNKTQLNQIFSGTQKAKFIGLYQRPGQLMIYAAAQVLPVGTPAGAFHVLLWQISSINLSGTTLSLNEWMP